MSPVIQSSIPAYPSVGYSLYLIHKIVPDTPLDVTVSAQRNECLTPRQGLEAHHAETLGSTTYISRVVCLVFFYNFFILNFSLTSIGSSTKNQNKKVRHTVTFWFVGIYINAKSDIPGKFFRVLCYPDNHVLNNQESHNTNILQILCIVQSDIFIEIRPNSVKIGFFSEKL